MLSTDTLEDRFLAFRTTCAVQTDDADLAALAIAGAAVADFAAQHRARLVSKILIDTTNNMRETTLHTVDAFTAQAPNAIQVRAFNTLGVDGLDAAATVDGMARLWFALAFGQGRRFAFKLLAE